MGVGFTPLAPAFEFPWQRQQRLRGDTAIGGRGFLLGNGGAPLVPSSLPLRVTYVHTLASGTPAGDRPPGQRPISYRAACAESRATHAGFVGTSLHRCVEHWVLREVLWGWRRATRTEEEHRTLMLDRGRRVDTLHK